MTTANDPEHLPAGLEASDLTSSSQGPHKRWSQQVSPFYRRRNGGRGQRTYPKLRSWKGGALRHPSYNEDTVRTNHSHCAHTRAHACTRMHTCPPHARHRASSVPPFPGPLPRPLLYHHRPPIPPARSQSSTSENSPPRSSALPALGSVLHPPHSCLNARRAPCHGRTHSPDSSSWAGGSSCSLPPP